jgi:L-lactate dehydrogenase complex protein LldE
MVRNHYAHLPLRMSDDDRKTAARTYELSEFLVDVLGIDDLGARFPHVVALHQSCHGLRELGLGRMSERMDAPKPSPAERLLSRVRGITVTKPSRPDECCGFGGTFSVFEEPVSARMGYDKVKDHQRAGAEYIVSADMSCMMHQKGCAERLGLPIKFIHVAQVLNGARE